MMNEALKYAKMGLSIIPCGPDKRPLEKWLAYQEKRATEEEIRAWWNKYPNANIGIVTGLISGITVLDCDSTGAISKFREVYKGMTPCVKTPRGIHFYFKYEPGVRNTVKVAGLDLDIRGDGGYVIAPPSVNSEGLSYAWQRELKDFSALSSFDGIKDFFVFNRESQNNNKSESHKSQESQPVTEYFISGRRDNDLFHAANCLIKGYAENNFVYQVIKTLAENCNPPFPEKEIEAKIQSAIERGKRKDKNIMQDIKDWLESQEGHFRVTDYHNQSQLVTKQEKHAANVAMVRLVEQGVLERYGEKSGTYRKKQIDLEIIDWKNAADDEYEIRWPLNLQELVKLYPGNIAVIAGASNTGKTSFMLELIRLNQFKKKITYFNSEMAASELRLRLIQFADVCPISKWDFRAVERSNNFADVIDPDGMNVIDFLEVYDEFWKIGAWIRDIHQKLKTGIAVIAIQKKASTKSTTNDFGRGGELTLEKPRLYLSMDRGMVKIIKGKIWRKQDINPNGLTRQFKLVGGWKFLPQSEWLNEEGLAAHAKKEKYANYGIGKNDPDFVPEDDE
jgi:hypothetical protein